MNVRQLLTSAAVRQAAHRMLQEAREGKLQCWTIDMGKLPEVADLVATITRRNYPSLAIPFHSRWRHFDVGGVDRWAALQRQWGPLPPRELARRAFDLVIPSVLSDAGSGGRWSFADPDTGKTFTSSEGLALASLQLYKSLIGASPSGALRGSASRIPHRGPFRAAVPGQRSEPAGGCRGPRCPAARAGRNLPRTGQMPSRSEGPARPGGLVDAMFARSQNGAIAAPDMLAIVLDALGPIWPSRLTLQGIPLGDSWNYAAMADGCRARCRQHRSLPQALAVADILPHRTAAAGRPHRHRHRRPHGPCRIPQRRPLRGWRRAAAEGSRHAAIASHRADSLLVIEWRALTVGTPRPVAAPRGGAPRASSGRLPPAPPARRRHVVRRPPLAQQLRPDRSPPSRSSPTARYSEPRHPCDQLAKQGGMMHGMNTARRMWRLGVGSMKAGSVLTPKATGILLLIASVSCFGAVDGFSKMLVDTHSFGQIMLARYAPALAVLLIAIGPRNWKGLFATRHPGLQVVRGITPVFVGGLMVFAVRYLPLAEATVILFAGPFIVVALSGRMLARTCRCRELDRRRHRLPGRAPRRAPGLRRAVEIHDLSGAGGRVLRAAAAAQPPPGAAGESPCTTLAWTLLRRHVISLPLAVADWPPSLARLDPASPCLGASFGWGQHFLARAFSLAPANVLTPFSYFQILSATIFGVVVFHNFPDLLDDRRDRPDHCRRRLCLRAVLAEKRVSRYVTRPRSARARLPDWRGSR